MPPNVHLHPNPTAAPTDYTFKVRMLLHGACHTLVSVVVVCTKIHWAANNGSVSLVQFWSFPVLCLATT